MTEDINEKCQKTGRFWHFSHRKWRLAAGVSPRPQWRGTAG